MSSIIKEAIEIAKKTNLAVEFKISGVKLEVNKFSEVETIFCVYEEKISKALALLIIK